MRKLYVALVIAMLCLLAFTLGATTAPIANEKPDPRAHLEDYLYQHNDGSYSYCIPLGSPPER